ncbi:sensor histidine kinase [Candidatus Magnetomonas plexicatena]|uniref:sensor histidine kinase n=1 Tax=Candidatus Magnetomonas plexicatena TaxID=2552947 RepID=UPI001C74FB7E|nr:PAS domain S-box protein [Nitrospirales bacterium LBB_01]
MMINLLRHAQGLLKKRIKYRPLVFAYIIICLTSIGITINWTKETTLQNLHVNAMDSLNVYDKYLTDKMRNYIVQAEILAGNQMVIEFCKHPTDAAVMNEYLSRFNDSVGGAVAYIMNTDGRTVSSSNYKSPQSFIGKNYNFREYFQSAVKGQPDRYIAIGTTSKAPGYYSAYPVINGKTIVGVVVIKYDLNVFEPEIDQINGILLLVDENDVVFLSNDNSYRFHTVKQLSDEVIQKIKVAKQYGTEPLPPIPIIKTTKKDNLIILTIRKRDAIKNKDVDAEYLFESAHSDKDDWHIHLLVGLSEVNSIILRNCLYVFLAMTVVFLIGVIMFMQSLNIMRRNRHEIEIKKINEALENKVKERTIELKDYNLQLQNEITERKAAEDAVKAAIVEREKLFNELQLSEQKYRQLVELSSEGIWSLDKNAITTFVNPAMAQMLGFTVEEMLGKPLFDFMDEAAIERTKVNVDFVHNGTTKKVENTHIHKDGRTIHVFVSAVPAMDQNGDIQGSFAVVTDITKRKEADEALKISFLEKKLLLRELHHRVKNNLQLIAALIGLQLKHVTDETYREMFIESQNRVHSISLIHEKLYNSENLAEIDFNNYISTLASDIITSLSADTSTINLKLDIVKNVTVGVDIATPCGLIINELLTNALKHAFKDGRYDCEISISLRVFEDKFVLTISDNGNGIAKDLDIGKTKSVGLQIVSVLVRQLRGTIEFDRTNGTKVTIIFRKSEDVIS